MSIKFKHLDPVIIIGIIISIAVAIFLVLIGQDQAISLLIGLTLTVISLLIDTIGRINESEDRILKASALETTLTKEPMLLTTMSQISTDYALVQNSNYALFMEEAEKALLQCRDTMHNLAEGRIFTDVDNVNIGYTTSRIHVATSNIKTAAYADISFWTSQYGKYAFEHNVGHVKRGIKFTRIWIQTHETLINHKNLLKIQNDAGIETFIALPEELPHFLLEDYRLIDDRILIKMELYANGKAKSQHISINPAEVGRAVENFALLLKYARSYDDFFKAE